MKRLGFILTAITFLYLSGLESYGQGCSDAGFCTINSFKPSSEDSTESSSQFNN